MLKKQLKPELSVWLSPKITSIQSYSDIYLLSWQSKRALYIKVDNIKISFSATGTYRISKPLAPNSLILVTAYGLFGKKVVTIKTPAQDRTSTPNFPTLKKVIGYKAKFRTVAGRMLVIKRRQMILELSASHKIMNVSRLFPRTIEFNPAVRIGLIPFNQPKTDFFDID